MTASRTAIPEFTLTAELDVTAALELRRELNELSPDARVSVNDLLVKAVALALREFPRLNASYVDDGLVQHARVNVGVAVATDDALLVPTVFDADRASLQDIAAATREAAARANARKLDADALAGGTFTVSNLGMFGVTSFEAVINPPQVAILAVGRVDRRPVFADDGSVVARDLMHVSLSCDHRAVYGAEAARFLARLRELLERPLALMLGARGG
jgi:pyruvate dehydrogenase E2 component (dihydrolipoamide acetyltransferase)